MQLYRNFQSSSTFKKRPDLFRLECYALAIGVDSVSQTFFADDG